MAMVTDKMRFHRNYSTSQTFGHTLLIKTVVKCVCVMLYWYCLKKKLMRTQNAKNFQNWQPFPPHRIWGSSYSCNTSLLSNITSHFSNSCKLHTEGSQIEMKDWNSNNKANINHSDSILCKCINLNKWSFMCINKEILQWSSFGKSLQVVLQ